MQEEKREYKKGLLQNTASIFLHPLPAQLLATAPSTCILEIFSGLFYHCVFSYSRDNAGNTQKIQSGHLTVVAP